MSLRVELADRLPVPSWYEPPGLIVVDRARWLSLDSAGRVELLAREAAHHLLHAVYPPRLRGWRRVQAWRCEERGRRLALETLVGDGQVLRGADGEDRPVFAWELADNWGRSPAWCAARVQLWRVRHPDVAAVVGPV